MMSLAPETILPELKLPQGYYVKSFQDFQNQHEWVNIVNHSIGEWDLQTAKYLFFNDKYFNPELCFFLLDHNKPVATSSGRIRHAGGVKIGELHMTAVSQKARGRGLGAAISLVVLHRIRDVHHGKIILRTDEWRLPAIKMHLRLGFRPVEKIGRTNHQSIWSSILTKLSL